MAKKKDKGPSAIDFFYELFRAEGMLCNFFKDTKFQRFYSEEIGFPSYKSVQGKNANLPPDGISFEERSTFPVHNSDKKDLSDAIRECEKLGRKIFPIGKKDQMIVSARDYMITGSTLPIRITYDILEKKKGEPPKRRREKVYVKSMDLSRIFMSALYSMITKKEIGTLFSESSVIIPEVKGKLLSDYNPEEVLSNPKLREELIRTSVDAYFLGLNDVDNDHNIIISPNKKRLFVIDFDKVYEDRVPDPCKQVLNPFIIINYRYDPEERMTFREPESYPDKKFNSFFKKGEIEEVVKDERENIYANLRRNLEEFSDLIRVMSRFNYYNLSVKSLFGEKDVISYYSGMHHAMRSSYSGRFKRKDN